MDVIAEGVQGYIDSKLSKKAQKILGSYRDTLIFHDPHQQIDRVKSNDERNTVWRREYNSFENKQNLQPQYNSSKYQHLSKDDVQFLIDNEMAQAAIYQQWKNKKEAQMKAQMQQVKREEQEKEEELDELVEQMEGDIDRNIVKWLYDKAHQARQEDLKTIKIVMNDVQHDYLYKQRRTIERHENVVKEGAYTVNTVPKKLFVEYEEGDVLEEYVPRLFGKRTANIPCAVKRNI
eukprot:TRINITY_DN19293_c0_g1_i1.p1 TRINITY_DN19293_c0_g1~~TRINITY_DN19293_c0_g1_i1.p1  ORF type:complete len:234 (-),score=39.94 TRINITY_DN19293_c0_g1_i1:129-830(-)